MKTHHKLTKLEDGDFEYRGVVIIRDDKMRGYSTHYRALIKSDGNETYSSTRRALLARIDDILSRPEAY